MTTTGWIAIKKGDCPVCGPKGKEHSNNCQKSHTVTGLILCRASQVDPTIKPAGYKYLGESRCGTWAKWIPTDSSYREEWTKEREDHWRREQQQRYNDQQRTYQQYLDSLLSVEERSEQYHLLKSKLLLTSDHESVLTGKRRLTLEEVEFVYQQGWLRSWRPGKKIDGLSTALAGVDPKTNRLLGVNGMSVACTDGQGHILGHQIVSDDREKFAKSLWLSSKSRGGSGPHLPNGELPLFVWRHPEATQITETWLVEGNLKSLITALRLWFREGRKDIQVIGASGAQWSGSKGFLKDGLTCQSTKKVCLMPDAGTLENKQVLQHCKNALDLLVEWGYAPYVGWWDQDSKDQPDIDELEDYTIIQLLNPPAFFEMAEPDEENVPPEWAWKNWLKSRKFTPTQIVDLEEFCFGDLPESDAVISANSGLGTRKTGAGIEVTRLSGRRSIWLGYRNNLLIQTCSRAAKQGINILHIREDDGVALVADVHTNLALCVDSIYHVDGYFKGTDIYLDETCSTLLHTITGGTLGDEQGKAISIFTKALQECDRIFLLDGNLSDLYSNFIVKLSGKKHDVRILNTKKSRKHEFKFILGVDVNEEIKKRDKSPIIKKMLEPGVIPWVASDSKMLTDVLHQVFQKHGKFRGYVLNKDTAAEPWAKEFLDDPDQFVRVHKPDYFIISPTGESGLSCTVSGHFTDKFSVFTGIQGSNQQYQIMIRLRDNTIPHYVLCPERSLISSSERNSPGAYSATAYRKMLEEKIIQSAILASQSSENPSSVLEIIGKAIARNNDDWWEFSATLSALDNFEQNYLRRCLMHVLESAGHDVEIVYVEIDEQTNEDMEWAREKVIEIHSEEMYNAHDLRDKDEVNKLAKSCPRKGIQRQIEKFRLLERLPGIKDSPVWNPKFIVECYLKDRGFITRQQRWFFLNNFEISQKKHEVDWYYKATKRHFYLSEAQEDSHLVIWALQQLNVRQFVTGEWHKDSPEVVALVEAARKKEISDALGLSPGVPTANGKERTDFLRDALALIGKKITMVGRKNVDGVRQRVYAIDPVADRDPYRLEVLAAIERKYSSYLESESVKKVSWESEHIEPPIPTDLPTAEPLIVTTTISEIKEFGEDAIAKQQQNSIALAASQLRACTDWTQLKLSQEEINSAWSLLDRSEQDRLQQLYEKSIGSKQQIEQTELVKEQPIAQEKPIEQNLVIAPRTRVRVGFRGSERSGMTGIISKISGNLISVRLDDKNLLPHLQTIEVYMPFNENTWLEAV